MNIRNLKTKVIGPVLLLIPMACMHSGDGHHSGGQHSIAPQPPNQYLSQGLPPEGVSGGGEFQFPRMLRTEADPAKQRIRWNPKGVLNNSFSMLLSEAFQGR